MLIENVHCYLMSIEILKTLIIIDRYWSTDGMLTYWYMEGCSELVCWDPLRFSMGKSKAPGHDLDCQRVTIQMSGKKQRKNPRLRGSRASSTKAKKLWSQTSMGSGSAFQPGAWMRLGGKGNFRGSLGCPEWNGIGWCSFCGRTAREPFQRFSSSMALWVLSNHKKNPIYMLGPQLDAAVASPDHLTVDFWYANVPAQVNFKAIHHHH